MPELIVDNTLESLKRHLACGGKSFLKKNANISRLPNVKVWNAVALQQHMSRDPKISIFLPSVVPNKHPLALTLAQRMGLVPAPPNPPTVDEWNQISLISLARENPLRQVCSICHELFSSTVSQNMVLLRCTHVFHEVCLNQFELFVRRNQGKGIIPQCPQCRLPIRERKRHFSGKVNLQLYAITKIQALFRGMKCREAYLRLKLRSNPNFRLKYTYDKFKLIADIYAITTHLHTKNISRFLNNLDYEREKGLAKIMTEKDWMMLRIQAIKNESCHDCPICMQNFSITKDWANNLIADNFHSTVTPSLGSGEKMPPRDSEKNDSSQQVKHPLWMREGNKLILLDGFGNKRDLKSEKFFKKDNFKDNSIQAGNEEMPFSDSRKFFVEGLLRQSNMLCEFPLEYETQEKNEFLNMNTKPALPPSLVNSSFDKSIRSSRDLPSIVSKKSKVLPSKRGHTIKPRNILLSGNSKASSQKSNLLENSTASTMKKMPIDCKNNAPSVLLLSCGHCYHVACLQTFEQYATESLTKEENFSHLATFRCPICRKAYIRRFLDWENS